MLIIYDLKYTSNGMTKIGDIIMKGNLILSATSEEDMAKLAGIIEAWEQH